MTNLESLKLDHLLNSSTKEQADKSTEITVHYTIDTLRELANKWGEQYPSMGKILFSKIAGLTHLIKELK